MNSGVTDCLVTGFEPLEAGLTELPDPDDRHVLAAAIHSGAQEIVTFNVMSPPPQREGVKIIYMPDVDYPPGRPPHLRRPRGVMARLEDAAPCHARGRRARRKP